MRTIYKYPLPVQDQVTLTLKEGAVPLCVQVQGGVPCLWAAIDTDASDKDFTFRIVGTGHPIDDIPHPAVSYLDTFQVLLGPAGRVFVGHVFQESP